MTNPQPFAATDARGLADRVHKRFVCESNVVIGDTGSGRVITSVTHDSRNVREGTLFVCVRGEKADGHAFAEEAVSRGASAVLVDHEIPGLAADQIVVADTRTVMAYFAAAGYGFPGDSMKLVGITGTNGKTTTAHTLEAILRAAGKQVGVIGTLTQKRTTPEATDMQERLSELRDSGCEIVVMEVTSHALELHRVRGLHYEVAIFTNLSQDHLDFHGSIEAYFRAKAKLFTPEYCASAIVNADDRHGRLLVDSAMIPTEAIAGTDASNIDFGPTGSTFVFRGQNVRLPIAGPFNVMNAMQAMAAARTIGVDWEPIIRGVSQVHVAGRFEPVDHGQDFAVYVDFAHTPDGLERVLQAARDSLRGGARLISVFGCGGDRDRTKRPHMAAIGQRLSDVAIFTSDNPRSERPEDILNDMLAGVVSQSNVTVIIDRREAIAAALRQARTGDVVVVAGKGHEQGQESRGVVAPFDDRLVVRNALDDLRGAS